MDSTLQLHRRFSSWAFCFGTGCDRIIRRGRRRMLTLCLLGWAWSKSRTWIGAIQLSSGSHDCTQERNCLGRSKISSFFCRRWWDLEALEFEAVVKFALPIYQLLLSLCLVLHPPSLVQPILKLHQPHSTLHELALKGVVFVQRGVDLAIIASPYKPVSLHDQAKRTKQESAKARIIDFGRRHVIVSLFHPSPR